MSDPKTYEIDRATTIMDVGSRVLGLRAEGDRLIVTTERATFSVKLSDMELLSEDQANATK